MATDFAQDSGAGSTLSPSGGLLPVEPQRPSPSPNDRVAARRYPPTEGRLYEAWRRARRRSLAAGYGIDPDYERAVGAEFIRRPHEIPAHELLAAVSLGRKLARRFGW